jgi:3-aminobutyryl-CoA ammonia-lyase
MPTVTERPGNPEAPVQASEGTDTTSGTTAFLRVRLNEADAYYGGNVVEGAHVLRLFGDLVTEITVREDGDEGLLAGYVDVRFSAPVAPGDYLEVRGRLVRRTRLRRVVELSAHKVIAADPGTRPSAARLLPEPRLVCSATATTVVPREAVKEKEAR